VPTDVKERALSLAIDETDNTASVELALSVAGRFGLKLPEARAIAGAVAAAVKPWRRDAARLGLKPREIDRMATAFEHHDAAI